MLQFLGFACGQLAEFKYAQSMRELAEKQFLYAKYIKDAREQEKRLFGCNRKPDDNDAA